MELVAIILIILSIVCPVYAIKWWLFGGKKKR